MRAALGDVQAPYVRPVGATEILLVRHGATANGASLPDGVVPHLDGHANPPLTPRGRDQAQALALRLSNMGVDRLFVTTLIRTHQTAEPVAAKLGLVPEAVPDLREINLGELEGDEFERRRAAGDTTFYRALELQRWDVIPGAEDMELFSARVFRGLEHVADVTGPDATAVAIVHGAVIAEAMHRVTKSERFAFIETENASISTIIRHPDGRWRLRSYNDTAHLA